MIVWDRGTDANLKDDDAADARRNPASSEPESVKTGRTLDEVAEGEES